MHAMPVPVIIAVSVFQIALPLYNTQSKGVLSV